MHVHFGFYVATRIMILLFGAAAIIAALCGVRVRIVHILLAAMLGTYLVVLFYALITS